jgi:hypothetical protein
MTCPFVPLHQRPNIEFGRWRVRGGQCCQLKNNTVGQTFLSVVIHLKMTGRNACPAISHENSFLKLTTSKGGRSINARSPGERLPGLQTVWAACRVAS